MQTKITIKKLLPVMFVVGLKTLGHRLRRKASGVGLMIIAAFFISLAVTVGLVAMFFALANMDNFVTPSLITSGVIVLIAFLIGIQGKRLLK